MIQKDSLGLEKKTHHSLRWHNLVSFKDTGIIGKEQGDSEFMDAPVVQK